MRTLLSARAAANTLLVAFALVVVWQVVVLSGVVPLEMIWGGRLRSEDERVRMCLLSIVVALVMAGVVWMRMKRPASVIWRYGIWLVVALFALNTVGNIVATDLREKLIFTPITLVLTLLAVRAAIADKYERSG